MITGNYLVLDSGAVLKRLASPSVYHTGTDSLYELDEEGFLLLQNCAVSGVPEDSIKDRGFLDFCIEEGILRPSDTPAPRSLRLRPAPVQ